MEGGASFPARRNVVGDTDRWALLSSGTDEATLFPASFDWLRGLRGDGLSFRTHAEGAYAASSA